MRGVWMLAWIGVVACSSQSLDTAARQATDSTSERELIPAEWTVAEDTSEAGEVTTSSVQLPAARDIAGLLQDDTPRLVLRCLEGKVAAFIDTDPLDGTPAAASDGSPPAVRIELDVAPPCE